MSDDQPGTPLAAQYTTNEEDQAEAAKLKARLAAKTETGQSSFSSHEKVPSVTIASGAHKYVLISARDPSSGESTHFVTSKRGAHYHRNAAEPLVHKLETNGYTDIDIQGGGRISLDQETKQISIFGYSYSFGQANHAISRAVIKGDERYKDYKITISDAGY